VGIDILQLIERRRSAAKARLAAHPNN